MISHKINLHLKRWLNGCLLIFIASCNEAPGYNEFVLTSEDSLRENKRLINASLIIADAKKYVEDGDMILRTGNDFTSESLRKFSQKDKTYSHCGIASIENDSIFVYHALGGEWNPDQKLRRDPWELFCNAHENRGFGIFTFEMDNANKKRLDSVVHEWYQRELTFDMDFNLETDDRLYCAEFVAKAYLIAFQNAIVFDKSRINEFEFYAVDNLMLHKNVVEKKRHRFE